MGKILKTLHPWAAPQPITHHSAGLPTTAPTVTPQNHCSRNPSRPGFNLNHVGGKSKKNYLRINVCGGPTASDGGWRSLDLGSKLGKPHSREEGSGVFGGVQGAVHCQAVLILLMWSLDRFLRCNKMETCLSLRSG
uniref:Uncharacterized protein n=1 Tax=Anguilla anguilla TaxID=7936 RepID=A0A0E9X769_ANGAN